MLTGAALHLLYTYGSFIVIRSNNLSGNEEFKMLPSNLIKPRVNFIIISYNSHCLKRCHRALWAFISREIRDKRNKSNLNKWSVIIFFIKFETKLICFTKNIGLCYCTVRLLTHVLCKPTHFFFHSFIATMSYSLQTTFNSVMKDWADKYHVWGTPTRSPSKSSSR